jgi:glycosyltransferase involved in cell wall biosynthesis
MQVLLTTTRAWHLNNTAEALSARHSLAGLWMADKNAAKLAGSEYQRCWPYHLAMKPFYHCATQIWCERATYALRGLWAQWLKAKLSSKACPDFDVVHAIMGFAGELFEAAEKRGALKVVDCPNSHPTSYFGYWQRECDLWCPGEKVPIPRWMFARMNRELERADVVLCPSNFVRDTMVLNGISTEKCFVNPFGADTSIFTPRSKPPERSRFISVGTFSLRKGYQYLFRAFQQVKAEIPSAELVCVGGYKCDFRRERPRWEGTFTHIPSLNHPDLARLLQTCTAFVLPSCEEGFARVIIEAMAAGLPIIATYESGATTLVENGKEGIIVSQDPRQIADAMIRLAKDSSLCARMGNAAHMKGAVSNTWQDYGDRLLLEYQKRLNAKRFRFPL